jgi:hypothetical protein
MVPVLIGLGIAAAAAGLTVIVLKFLDFTKIRNWFRGKHELVEQDKANIIFTLQTCLANKNYGTVQGVFNTRTNELAGLKAGQRYEAKDVDPTLKGLHQNNTLVIYEK